MEEYIVYKHVRNSSYALFLTRGTVLSGQSWSGSLSDTRETISLWHYQNLFGSHVPMFGS